MPEPIVMSWSGGKDSSLALAELQRDPAVEVVGLLTSVTRDYERISIHGVRRTLLHAQARALGLPLFEVTIAPACSNEEYEAAFLDAVVAMRRERPDLRRLAFGDLFLTDVREYRERLVARAGIEAHFPLWELNTKLLAREFVASAYRARLVCVDTTQLSGEFAGRMFDDVLLAELPESVDPCGERGEFHTFVSDGPIFQEPVGYRLGEVVLRDERFAYCDLLDAPAPLSSLSTSARGNR